MSPFQHPAFQSLFTLLACLLGGLLAYLLVGSALAPALFWPPAGIAIGAALLWGWRVIPAAALGTGLAAEILAGPAMPGLWLGLAVAVQATLGRLLLARAGVSSAFSQVGDLFRLLLHGGFIAALAAAPLAYLALRHQEGFWEYDLARQVVALLLGQLDGVLVFATLMLGWRNTDHPGCLARHLEIGLVLLALGLGAMLLSQPMLFGLSPAPMRPYPLLPLLLWLALRADMRLLTLALACVYAVLASNKDWGHWAAEIIPDTHWIRPLNGFVTVVATSFLALGMLMATNRRLEQAQRVNALAQRDALIREVHHRIKNNLQIVVGLLRRDAARHPETGPLLESAISQVQAIAEVHGLHGRVTQSGVMLCELLPHLSQHFRNQRHRHQRDGH